MQLQYVIEIFIWEMYKFSGKGLSGAFDGPSYLGKKWTKSVMK